jgi:sulfotransferase family protein
MRLPDVIGIGARRCGSSWLHGVLDQHPRVGKPANGLHFFSMNYDRGVRWYAEQLGPFADRPVLLEFSVSYLYPEHARMAAERMADIVPSAKLFVCLRDPVARAWSDYLRSVRMGEFSAKTTFDEAIERHPELVERGRYGALLRPYYERFGDRRIKVLLYDDLESNQKAYVSGLLDFVGLDAAVDPAWFTREEPRGKTVRSEFVNSAVRRLKTTADRTAEALGVVDAWSNLKARHMTTYERLLELNHRKVELQPESESRLRRHLADDMHAFAAMTGCNVEHWHAR